jgi:hypothetical protein
MRPIGSAPDCRDHRRFTAVPQLHWLPFVSHEPQGLWQVHLRIPERGPVAISVMRGECRITDGVIRPSTPGDALRMLEQLLEPFGRGDQLFITARAKDSRLSMWRTQSKATALYWCASALSKLWSGRSASPSEDGAVPNPPPRTSWLPPQPVAR